MTLKKIDLAGGTGGRGGQYEYIAPNGAVVTSTAPVYGSNSNYHMRYLFDGSIDENLNGSSSGTPNKYWLTSSSGNQSLTFDFKALELTKNPIKQINIYPKIRNDASSDYRVLVSADASSWQEVIPWIDGDSHVAWGMPVSHQVNIDSRFLKIELTRNGAWGVGLDEIEFFSSSDPTPIKNITYTSNVGLIGNTKIISWSKSNNANRYELQYYEGEKWISLSNNIVTREYYHELEKCNSKARYRVRAINSVAKTSWITGASFEVRNEASINGEMTITPSNEIKAHIKVQGFDLMDVEGAMEVAIESHAHIDSCLNIENNNMVRSINGDIEVEVSSKDSISGEMVINPTSKARSFIEVRGQNKLDFAATIAISMPTKHQLEGELILSPTTSINSIPAEIEVEVRERSSIGGTLAIYPESAVRSYIEIQGADSSDFSGHLEIAMDGLSAMDGQMCLVKKEESSSIRGNIHIKVSTDNALDGTLVICPESTARSHISIMGLGESDLSGQLEVAIDKSTQVEGLLVLEEKISNNSINASVDIIVSTKSFIEADLFICPTSTARGHIAIVGVGESDLAGQLEVAILEEDEVPGWLVLKDLRSESSIDASIDIEVSTKSSINGILIVNAESAARGYVGIKGLGYSSIGGELALAMEDSTEINGCMSVVETDANNSIEALLDVEVSVKSHISGEMVINPYSTARGFVDIVGYGESSIDGFLLVEVMDISYLEGEMELSAVESHSNISADINVRVDINEEIKGNLVIHPNTTARSFVEIVGYGEKDLEAEITIVTPGFNYLQGALEVSSSDTESSLDGEVYVEVSTKSSINAELIVYPSNTMRSYVDIIPPVVYSYNWKPINDTMASERAPYVNYGRMYTMVTGKTANNQFISYLMFDLSKVRSDVELKDVHLKLHQMYHRDYTGTIEIYETHNNWTEDWVKWLNRPELGELVTTQEVYANSRICRVDMVDYYKEKINREAKVISFAIISDKQLSFGTKEDKDKAPEFVFEYYEPLLNGGQYSFAGDIVVECEDESGISGEIYVEAEYQTANVTGEIILNAFNIDSDLDGTLTVALFGDQTFDSELLLSKVHEESSISGFMYIPHIDEIDASLELVKTPAVSDLNSDMVVAAYRELYLDSELVLEEAVATSKFSGDIDMDATIADTSVKGSTSIATIDTDLELEGSMSIEENSEFVNFVGEIEIEGNNFKHFDGDIVLEEAHCGFEMLGSIKVWPRLWEDIGGELVLKKTQIPTGIDGQLIAMPWRISEFTAELFLEEVISDSDLDGELVLEKVHDKSDIDATIIPLIPEATEVDGNIFMARGDIDIEFSGVIEDVERNSGDYFYIS